MDRLFIRLDRITRFQSDDMAESDLIEVIVKYNGDIRRVASETGAVAEILNSNYAIFTIPLGNLPALYGYSEVEFIELPKNVTYILRQSLNSACITPVQSRAGLGLTGRGVIVGIIDSGIDYTHPDFRNADGSSRILYIWDQSADGSPPEGFRSGTEYDNSQINDALMNAQPFSVVPSIDRAGHGTAVAGIIAGNGNASGGSEKGVAPEASIIAVKLGNAGNEAFARSTEIMRAIKYISDKALQLNMPVAINLSYGTNNGSHDGDSLFERYIDSMCEQWKTVIAVATGNEGNTGHHFHTKLTQGSTEVAEFAIAGNPRSMYLTLWKNFVDTVSLELIAPSGRSSGVIRPLQSVTRVTMDNINISVLYGQPNHYTVNQEVYFSFRSLEQVIPPGVWNLRIMGERIVDGNIDIWMPTGEDVSESTAFLRPEVRTTLTLPSTSKNVITVGGYNAEIYTAADFSGRGPARGDAFIKPDIVAPAVGIYTTRTGGGYDVFSGTSMAVPFVTGSAALMMEWGIVQENDLFMYGQRVKAFLRRGAERTFTLDYPNGLWGYGILHLCSTVSEMIEYTRGGGAFS
jgi:minor extracellular serine protease Vpr